MVAMADDLAQAILTWLDQRPAVKPSATWSTRQLRDSFRANLELNLLSARETAETLELMTRMLDAFTAATKPRGPGSLVPASRWSAAPFEGPRRATFPVMEREITQVLNQQAGDRRTSGHDNRDLAKSIVGALNRALSDEAAKNPRPGVSPEAVLHFYMIPMDVRRKFNVRTFLAFLGLLVGTAAIYALLEPGSLIDPATGLFIILGYATLILTAIVHEHSSASS
jgi:hypothetical protein